MFINERSDEQRSWASAIDDIIKKQEEEAIRKEVVKLEVDKADKEKYEASYNVNVGPGKFDVGVISEENGFKKSVRLGFPSQLDDFNADQIYPSLACVKETAFPRLDVTPTARLIDITGRYEDFDLRDHLKGTLHDKSLMSSRLKSAVYTVSLKPPNFRVPRGITVEYPLFVHGFEKENDGNIQEFVQITHTKAREGLGDEFSAELLSRNRTYTTPIPTPYDTKDLTRKIEFICIENPQKSISF